MLYASIDGKLDQELASRLLVEKRVRARCHSTRTGSGEREVLWERASDPAAWLDAHRNEVAWVRSEYEWVLELDGEQAAWSYWIGEERLK